MLSLCSPRRSPLVQVVARILILALVTMMVPLETGASIPARTENLTKSAFGELLAHTGTDPQPYAFTGEPLDPSSGFQYHRARWMDARSGRFTGMDPFEGRDGDPASLHRYLYAHVDPASKVDPTGRFASGAEISIGLALMSQIASQQVGLGFEVVSNTLFADNYAFQATKIVVTAGVAAFSISKLALGLLRSNVFGTFLSRLTGRGAPNDWARLSGMLRDAAKGKGNFGVGSATRAEADAVGRAWVGEGFRAVDGGILISADGLRQYRAPSWKPNMGKFQANLEQRWPGPFTVPSNGQWQGNAHIDIVP